MANGIERLKSLISEEEKKKAQATIKERQGTYAKNPETGKYSKVTTNESKSVANKTDAAKQIQKVTTTQSDNATTGSGVERLRSVLSGGSTEVARNAVSYTPLSKEVEKDTHKKRNEALEKSNQLRMALADLEQSYYLSGSKDERLKKQVDLFKTEFEAAEKEFQQYDLQLNMNEYGDKLTKTNKDDFFGTFGANYTQGELSQASNEAWNKYYLYPTEENRQYAEFIDTVSATYGENNKDVLDNDGWVKKSLAGYLPQFIDQATYTVGGALVGGLAGTAVGNPLAGAKVGGTTASGYYALNNARGAAFRELIAAGVDEETARAAAADEAVVSSILEMVDTGIDIFTLGFGTLAKSVGKLGVKGVAKTAAKKGAEEVAESALKKLSKGLAKYGINIAAEGAQEAAQEVVGITNREQALAGNTGVWNLARSSFDKAGNLSDEERTQVIESAKEGARIAAMMGGATTAVNTGLSKGINYAVDSNTGKRVQAANPEAVSNLIQSGLESEAGTDSYKLATKLNSRQAENKRISNASVGRLYNANIRDKIDAMPSLKGVQNDAVNGTQDSRATSRSYNSVGEAISGFGKNGAKAFSNNFTSETDLDSYSKGFTRYYEAGVTGLEFEQIDTEYSKNISEATQKAAYFAGQNDAKASLAQEVENAQYATTYGKAAGFIKNNVSADMDRGTIDTLNVMAKGVGAKITMAEQINNGRANGVKIGGTINIAKDADNPYFVVAKHEIDHLLEEIAPVEHRAYRDYVMQVLSKNTDSADITLVEQKKAQYAEAGVNLTTEEAMSEIAADFTEHILRDENALKDFINNADKNVVQRFFDAVREFINRVKKALKGNKSAQDAAALEALGVTIEQLEKAEQLWKDTYKAAQKKTGTQSTKETKRIKRERAAAPRLKPRYSLNSNFAAEFDEWMKLSDTEKRKGRFLIGTTSEALQSIGIKEYNIYWDKSSLEAKMRKHKELTPETIKQLPDVIENPVLILQSSTVANSITVWGEVFAEDGKPIMVAIKLDATSKTGVISDYAVITSAYKRPITQLQKFLDNPENILYLDKNKKRTDTWLQSLGLQLPPLDHHYGSLRKVSLENDSPSTDSKAQQGEEVKGRFSFKRAAERQIRDADRMEANGMKPKEIWEAIGVIRDAKGNWITEIDDSQMKYHRMGDAAFSRNHPEYAEYQQLLNQMLYGSLAETELARLRELEEVWGREGGRLSERVASGNATLQDVIEHDALFEAFPQLRKTRVVFKDLDNGTKGSYSPSADVIFLSEQLRNDPESTLLHEIQHAIQRIERREGGSSPEYWQERIDRGEIFRSNDKQIAQAEKDREAAWMQMSDELKNKVREINRESIKARETGDYDRVSELIDAIYESEEADLYSDYDNALFEISMYSENNDPLDAAMLYNNTAGEIEARETQYRRKMTAEERREKTPNLGWQAAVFTSDKGNFESEAKAKFSLKQGEREQKIRELKTENAELNQRYRELVIQKKEFEKAPEYKQLEKSIGNLEGEELEAAIAEYAAWEQNSGFADVSREISENIGKQKSNRSEIDRLEKEQAAAAKEEYRATYNEDLAKKYATKAARKFGTTNRWNLAGYLTVNGSLLDFSDGQGYRMQDHREISEVLDFLPEYQGYSDGMIEFMNLGNIRLQSYGIDIAKAPNSKQISMLRKFFESLNGEVVVDFSDIDGHSLESVEYARGTRVDRILRDIDVFFKTGKLPKQSVTAQFHERWSLKGQSDLLKKRDSDYLAAVERGDMETAQRMVDAKANEVFADSVLRDENGKLFKVYHGSKAKFNVFRGKEVSGADGEYFSPWKKFAEQYGEVRAFYVNLTNPIMYDEDFNTLNDVSEDEADGFVYIPEDMAGGIDQLRIGDTEIIVFDSNAIKSADPVTYDDDGNVIPLSERFKKRNEDIRFSLKGQSDLLKENAKLKEYNDYLKQQLKTTDVIKQDKKKLQKLASDILKEYGSDYGSQELYTELEGLYDYIANEEQLAWEDIKPKAREVARKILSEATVTNDELYQSYKDLRKHLKSSKIYIAEQDRADLSDEYNEFRKANFGKFTLSNDGIPVDIIYSELADMYPEFFDAERYTHPADQLDHISEVLESLKPIEENPYTYNMREATEWLANDIIDRYFDIPQQKPTFADKQKQKLEKQKYKDAQKLNKLREQKNEQIAKIREQSKERIREAVKKERAAKSEKIKEVKEKQKEKEKRMSTRRKQSVMVNKIRKHVKTINKMLLNPTDTSHVPEALRKPVGEFMNMLDLTTDRLGEKSLNRLRDLQDIYQEIADGKTDYYMDVDPDLIDNLKQVIAGVKDKAGMRIVDMELNDLEALYRATLAVERSIYSYNRMMNDARTQTIREYGEAALEDLKTNKPYLESRSGVKQSVADVLNMSMLAPQDYFEELGGTMSDLFSDIRDGLDTKIDKVYTAQQYIEELTKNVDIKNLTGDKAKAKTFKLTNGEISLTPAQVMSLYLLNRQPDAQNHIFMGGIKAAPVVAIKEGKRRIPKITKSFETLRVNPEDIAKILKSMTKEERRIAEGISKFFTDYTAEWGNEVSLKLYGYKKFTVENYFPIVSDRNYIAEVFGETTDVTLKNMGSTKARQKGANNPIVIEDAFDVFARQADQMSSYNAFVIPLGDIQKVYNYKTYDGSVKEAIEKKFGRRATDYFSKLMTDINGGAKYNGGWNLLNIMISKYKQARMGLNLRVVAQQPTAILRTMALMNPKYLAAALPRSVDIETVKKYAPIARWKDWGNFSLDTSKSMKSQILNTKELSDYTMWAAGAADRFAWKRIWAAVELETRDKRPDLKRGSEEYYKAVGKRFSEIIDKTQVVDSVLHRAQIMRNPDTLVKMSVSFMSEPMRAYNMLRTALRNAKENPTKAAKQAAVATVFGYLASITVNHVITGLIDTWRGSEDDEFMLDKITALFSGEEDDEENEEKLTFMERWLKHFADNLANEPLGYIPYAKDIVSMAQGYDIKRMDTQGFSDLIAAAQRAMSDKYTPLFKVADLSAKTGDLFGVPASNVKRELEALVKALIGATGEPVIEYKVARSLYSVTGNKAKYMDILYEALKSGDTESYNYIVEDLISEGLTGKYIENAMNSRAKKDFGREMSGFDGTLAARGIKYAAEVEEKASSKFKVDDLDGTSYVEYTEIRGAALEEIISDFQSDGFDQLDEETQNALMEAAYTYANSIALQEASDGKYVEETKWIEQAATAPEDLGLSTAEYIMFKDEYGTSITHEKFKAAMDAGMDAREYLEVYEKFGDTDAKDANGNTVSGLKKQRMSDYLNSRPDISEEEYYYFMREVFGYKI